MNPVYQKLFDAYAEPIVDELRHFPHRELVDLLNSLPIKESRRIDFYDQARHLYYQCSADAFVIGLHLGLSLQEPARAKQTRGLSSKSCRTQGGNMRPHRPRRDGKSSRKNARPPLREQAPGTR